MKAPFGPPKVAPAVPSVETERSGGAALEGASSWITLAAASPAGELIVMGALMPFSASLMMLPPAPEISALIHTTQPSYLLACTATVPPFWSAFWMICCQVTGLFMSMPDFWTNDLRYHRIWVLDQNGATTSWFFQVAAAVAPLNAWFFHLDCRSCGIFARYPAFENSAVYGGSMLIRSMVLSPAASRRASWIRCWPASCGNTWVSMLYLSVLQFLATASCPPASGLMYHVSVVLPELLQAASTLAATARARAEASMERRLLGSPRGGEVCDMVPLRR